MQPQTLAVEPASTPERSPSKRRAIITHAQKQALIDNLQLEITERARKLRAQYALQAQGLRARLEMRVNRIPQALRKTNIHELMMKCSEQATAPTTAAPATVKVLLYPSQSRGTKRQSTDISADDKENAPLDLSLPKKRAKTSTTTAATANTRATRTASRTINKPNPSQVLSPKSNNSRTLPRSPVRPVLSPTKSFLARPVSPLKPLTTTTSTNATAACAASHAAPTAASTVTAAPPPPAKPAARTASRQAVQAAQPRGKRAQPPKHKRGSSASDSSAGTTIVTKPAAAPAPAPPAAKRGLGSRIAGMAGAAGRKAAAAAHGAGGGAAKREAAAAAAAATGGPVAGGRVLRKRN
ncbi:hypothetical protein B0A49_07360 [Cryomyces minteri]|uniref:Borealin N-terminal domain-containing protein n=1 Tax=Cryomyces minteri TaxID=331657 RepID=A0A4U0WMI1_9PEZI|nr:hypothetical protein B0A49_07360 [Cryomyces minteri]